jgi:hypothetical protein
MLERHEYRDGSEPPNPHPRAVRAARTRKATSVVALIGVALTLLVAPHVLAQDAASGGGTAVPDAAVIEEHFSAAARARHERNWSEAQRELDLAEEAGADPQRLELERGYAALEAHDVQATRAHFERAAQGPDPERAEIARRQLRYVPSWIWGSVYLEGYGWHRFVGPQTTDDVVPTLRVRALARPFLDANVDFNFYVYGQITRDVASRDRGPSSLPLVYADNHALVGGGALLRLFGGHLALWAQIGPAFNLLNDGRDVVSLDARAGAQLFADSDECRVPAMDGARFMAAPCLEGYGDLTYVSRFDHDVIGMLRGRAGYGLLLTGPVLWQPLIEVRGFLSRNGDFYNNFAEVGAGVRWRLVEPIGIDLLATVHGGAYYGIHGRDPVPSPQHYGEVRLLLVTYLELF